MRSAAFQKIQNDRSILHTAFSPGKKNALQEGNEMHVPSATSPGFNFGSIPIYDKPSKIQPKLKINEPGDVYEQEADAMADKVMRMSDTDGKQNSITSSSSTVQRKCAECEKEDEEQKLQRKENNTATSSSSYAPSLVHDVLNSSGRPMDNSTRSFMESRFHHDFSHVKIHDNNTAAESAGSINALAYTSGNNIVFNKGSYMPGTESGKRLLAHELTHVVQTSESDIIWRTPATSTWSEVAVATQAAHDFAGGDDIKYRFDKLNGVVYPNGDEKFKDKSKYRIREGRSHFAIWYDDSGWFLHRRWAGIRFAVNFDFDGYSIGNLSCSLLDVYDSIGYSANVYITFTPTRLTFGDSAIVRLTINIDADSIIHSAAGSREYDLTGDGRMYNSGIDGDFEIKSDSAIHNPSYRSVY